MPNKKKIDKRSATKEFCRKGCGEKFYPAGKGYHEKICTGPGYKAGYTPATKEKRRMRDGAVPQDTEVLCRKGCGYTFRPKGLVGHENKCKGPGYVSRFQTRNRGITKPKPDLKVRARQEAPAYTAYYAPINDVRMAYEMYKDDFALGSAICHVLACKTGLSVEDQIKHLTQARDMLTLKIESLS